MWAKRSKNDVELTISDIDSKIIFLQELFPLNVDDIGFVYRWTDMVKPVYLPTTSLQGVWQKYMLFSLNFVSNVLVMEIGWTDVGSGGYILVSRAHSNTSLKSVQHFHVVTTCQFFIYYTIILWFFTKFKYLQIMRKLYLISVQ
jgi:hypothetical protein